MSKTYKLGGVAVAEPEKKTEGFDPSKPWSLEPPKEEVSDFDPSKPWSVDPDAEKMGKGADLLARVERGVSTVVGGAGQAVGSAFNALGDAMFNEDGMRAPAGFDEKGDPYNVDFSAPGRDLKEKAKNLLTNPKFDADASTKVAEVGSTILPMLNPAGVPIMVASGYQQGFDDGKAKGMTDDEAARAGAINAAAQGVAGKILGPVRWLKDAAAIPVAQGAKAIAGSIASSAGKAAVRGAIEGPVMSAGHQLAMGDSLTSAESLSEDLQAARDNAMAAGVLGGAFRGLGHVDAARVDTTPVPESNATLQAQRIEMVAGKREAMLYTPGAKELPVPEGFARLKTKAGVFHYDPEAMEPAELHAAVKDDRIGDILDYGIPAKPPVDQPHTAVVRRDGQGNEIEAVATDQASLPNVLAKVGSRAEPGQTVATENPANVVRGRTDDADLMRALTEGLPADRRVETRQMLQFGLKPEVREANQATEMDARTQADAAQAQAETAQRNQQDALERAVQVKAEAEKSAQQKAQALSSAPETVVADLAHRGDAEARNELLARNDGNDLDVQLALKGAAERAEAREAEAQANEVAQRESMEPLEEVRGPELLQAIRRAGGMPRNDAAMGGELATLKEGQAPKGLFKAGAQPLDVLRENLAEQGFHFETPNDLLQAVDQRLRTGKEQFGEVGDKADVARYSRQEGEPTPEEQLGRAWTELTAHEATRKLGPSRMEPGLGLKAHLESIDPEAAKNTSFARMPWTVDGHTVFRMGDMDTYGHLDVVTLPNREFYINSLAMDKSNLGTPYYQAIYDWAAANKLKRVADPDGISDAGMSRTTAHAISNALRHNGNLEHFQPNAEHLQSAYETREGLTEHAGEWKEGNQPHNLGTLAKREMFFVDTLTQGAFKQWKYDLDTGSFTDETGRVIPGDQASPEIAARIKSLNSRDATRVGPTTVKRALISSALLRRIKAERVLHGQDRHDGLVLHSPAAGAKALVRPVDSLADAKARGLERIRYDRDTTTEFQSPEKVSRDDIDELTAAEKTALPDFFQERSLTLGREDAARWLEQQGRKQDAQDVRAGLIREVYFPGSRRALFIPDNMGNKEQARAIVKETAIHDLLNHPEMKPHLREFFDEHLRPEDLAEFNRRGYGRQEGESLNDWRERIADEFIAQHGRQNTSLWHRFLDFVRVTAKKLFGKDLTRQEVADGLINRAARLQRAKVRGAAHRTAERAAQFVAKAPEFERITHLVQQTAKLTDEQMEKSFPTIKAGTPAWLRQMPFGDGEAGIDPRRNEMFLAPDLIDRVINDNLDGADVRKIAKLLLVNARTRTGVKVGDSAPNVFTGGGKAIKGEAEPVAGYRSTVRLETEPEDRVSRTRITPNTGEARKPFDDRGRLDTQAGVKAALQGEADGSAREIARQYGADKRQEEPELVRRPPDEPERPEEPAPLDTSEERVQRATRLMQQGHELGQNGFVFADAKGRTARINLSPDATAKVHLPANWMFAEPKQTFKELNEAVRELVRSGFELQSSTLEKTVAKEGAVQRILRLVKAGLAAGQKRFVFTNPESQRATLHVRKDGVVSVSGLGDLLKFKTQEAATRYLQHRGFELNSSMLEKKLTKKGMHPDQQSGGPIVAGPMLQQASIRYSRAEEQTNDRQMLENLRDVIKPLAAIKDQKTFYDAYYLFRHLEAYNDLYRRIKIKPGGVGLDGLPQLTEEEVSQRIVRLQQAIKASPHQDEIAEAIRRYNALVEAWRTDPENQGMPMPNHLQNPFYMKHLGWESNRSILEKKLAKEGIHQDQKSEGLPVQPAEISYSRAEEQTNDRQPLEKLSDVAEQIRALRADILAKPASRRLGTMLETKLERALDIRRDVLAEVQADLASGKLTPEDVARADKSSYRELGLERKVSDRPEPDEMLDQEEITEGEHETPEWLRNKLGTGDFFQDTLQRQVKSTAEKFAKFEGDTLKGEPGFSMWLEHLKKVLNGFMRVPELAGFNGKRKSMFLEGLSRLRNATQYVQQQAAERVGAVVKPLTAIQDKEAFHAAYDLFRKKVAYSDLYFRSKIEPGGVGPDGLPRKLTLPYNLTEDEVAQRIVGLQKEIKASPHQAEIAEAIRRHYALVEAVRTDLENRGMPMPDHLKNPFYFPHKILEYWDGNVARVAKRIKGDFRSYLIDPVGSIKGIETDYIKAMYAHMAEVLAHNERADIVQRYWIDPYDEMKNAKDGYQMARQRDPQLHWEEWLDEKYPGFARMVADPNIPLRWETVVSPEAIVQVLGKDFTNTANWQGQLSQMGIKITPEMVKEILTVSSGKDRFLVPTEIKDAIQGVLKRDEHAMDFGALERITGPVLSAWKLTILHAPWNFIRYNANNVIADAEKIITGDVGMVRYMPQALQEVREFYKNNTPGQNEKLREALKRGVLQSVTVAEIQGGPGLLSWFKRTENVKNWGELPEIVQFKAFADQGKLAAFFRGAREKNLNPFWWSQDLSEVRESVFRYAKYLADLDRINQGKEPNYAGSLRAEVRALSSPYDKAAKIARETFVDYNMMSPNGEYLRRNIIPFYSWVEGNFRYHLNLFRNGLDMAKEHKFFADMDAPVPLASGAIGLLARLALPLMAIVLWNNRDEEARELESQLSAQDRRTFHINLGRDEATGEIKIINTNTAFADFMGWFSGQEVAGRVIDMLAGRSTFQQAIKDFHIVVAKNAVNKLVQGVGPALKIPLTAVLKRETFPDVFDSRPIPNYELRHAIMSQYDGSVADVIEGIVNKDFYAPKDFAHWAEQALLQVRRRDPAQFAYFGVKGDVADYLEAKGLSKVGGMDNREDAQLKANFRRAIYKADISNAIRFYNRLLDSGYTSDKFLAMTQHQDPLSDLPKSMRKEYVDGLSDYDKDQLMQAYTYTARLREPSAAQQRRLAETLFPSPKMTEARQEEFRRDPRHALELEMELERRARGGNNLDSVAKDLMRSALTSARR